MAAEANWVVVSEWIGDSGGRWERRAVQRRWAGADLPIQYSRNS